MGINGLLPFLKKIQKPVNVAQFHGCTVAVDAYCWLHKGAFSCAEKLSLGEKTNQYVTYCLKYIDYLLQNQLKPVLVFDGCHLPSKKDVETSRQERRERNRAKAAQLLREGKHTEAKEFLKRCLDITPQMALELMNACRGRGVDCIVAPYEADAQLAYLNMTGIAQLVISEDSDLLLFGCDKVIFKMDFNGNGILIERSDLNEVCEIQDGFYTFDKFRYMCILSGCDYLPSLPGIGLVKACKVFKIARQTDIQQVLRKLPVYLKMSVVVTEEYIQGFLRADRTFLYQLVFDPLGHRLCPLNPYPAGTDPEQMSYAGIYFDDNLALQIALGNIDVFTYKKIGHFDPALWKSRHSKECPREQHLFSIWDDGYQPGFRSTICRSMQKNFADNLIGKETSEKSTLPTKNSIRHVRRAEESFEAKTREELITLYGTAEPRKKRTKLDSNSNISMREFHFINSRHKCESQLLVSSERSKFTFSKIALSPSKQQNSFHLEQTLEKVSSMEKVFQTNTIQNESNREGVSKENKKLSPLKNKFAVSVLNLRSKFHLDEVGTIHADMEEVRSQYFNHVSHRFPGKTSELSPYDCFNGHKLKNVVSHFEDTECKTSGSVMNMNQQKEERMHDTSGLLPHVTSLERIQYLKEEQPSLVKAGDPRSSCANEVVTLSDHSIESQSFIPQHSFLQESLTTVGESEEGKIQQSSSLCVNRKRKTSPTPAFNWSKFMFEKSNGSNRSPRNLLLSKQIQNRDPKPTTTSDECISRYYFASPLLLQPDVISRGSGSSSFASSVSGVKSEKEEPGTQNLLSGSQDSNCYRTDCDCFPYSQNLVDITDSGDFHQSSEKHSSLTGSSSGMTIGNCGSSSQKMVVVPQSTLTTIRGNRRCRVPGLPKVKKTAERGSSKKQLSIEEMFFKFSNQT